MKIDIIDKTGKKIDDNTITIKQDVREDIFKKAVIAENSLFRQNTGATPLAGKKVSINVTKRRNKFRSTYGKSISRTPRKTMWRRGMQVRFVGAFAANTVGGRRAHPPKSSKKLLKDMNNKEWFGALKTGFIASLNQDLVKINGQKLPSNYPFILDDKIEDINKTKDVMQFLENIGFDKEIQRLEKSKIRAGKGTMRNRKYKNKRGPLFVVSSLESPLFKAIRNIKGFEVITPEYLMVSDFGMSFKPGRAVVFSKSAFEEFKEVLN